MVRCSWCYTSLGERPSCCGQCRKRAYCGRECQLADWKRGAHKHWCGRAGQLDHDFEIRAAPGDKGLGVFALRPFLANERIMVEQPIILVNDGRIQTCKQVAHDVVDELLPVGGSLLQKLQRNGIGCSEDSDMSGLFPIMSRVNNCCIGNCDHHYLTDQGVKMLVASRDIAVGEEVLFPYRPMVGSPNRRAQLQMMWKFDCQCVACTDGKIGEMLDRLEELDQQVMQLGSQGQTALALRKCQALIGIYDQLQLSAKLYSRTYYDMFQVAIVTSKTSGQGSGLAAKAARYASDFYGPQSSEANRYTELARMPSVHRNYHCLQ